MLEQFQNLTDGLIIYSARLSGLEVLDFKNDALAGVRANFFNSGCRNQSDTTEVVIDGLSYSLAYSMKQNEPLAWKVIRNLVPYQSVKRGGDGFYSVITYGSGGTVCKRQFFDNLHVWLKTEYYDPKLLNKLLTVVYPKNICGVTVIAAEDYDANGGTNTQILFPSDKKPDSQARMLIYSNRGMLWYDKAYIPDYFPESTDTGIEKFPEGGFVFSKERLERSKSGKIDGSIDLDNCEYLTDDEPLSESICKADNAEDGKPDEIGGAYSAYDVIEQILTDMSKTNKDLLGKPDSEPNGEPDDPTPKPAEEKSDADNLCEGDEKPRYVGAHFKDTGDDNGKTENTDKTKPESCNMVILTKSGRYTYYGALDQNNSRTGRGRTVSPDGFTSYDGEYKDDMRSGFGVCYYKNGSINYVGDWTDNARSGRGVGYRLSDGTLHAGTWLDNSPNGVGARFDGSGGFIDVCLYKDGVRSGKSVSFDENGNVIVAVYENGEKISEHIIDDEVLKQK